MAKLAWELGEFGLIERLRSFLGQTPDVLVGIGDDAAVVRGSGGRLLLVTADSLVQDVHFRAFPERAYDTGRKALAVNVSDIAAMGGRPTFAVVSLTLPADCSWDFVRELYRGLADEAALWNVAIVGGDTVAAPSDFGVHITLLGEAQEGRVVTRGGARVGDLIGVTYHLGAAAAGLAVLERPGAPVPAEAGAEVVARHLRPRPRVEAGMELAQGLASAMIDVSDGLAGDLGHICRASRVGARLYKEAIPIADSTRQVAAALGLDPLQLALRGGEDYELLFTTPRKDWGMPAELPRSRTPVAIIGEIVPEDEGIQLQDASGARTSLEAKGFTHF